MIPKHIPFLLLCLALLPMNAFSAQAPAHLQVSENQHYVVDENGNPFFWLGDTAWELFHRLDLEEAEHYLSVRAEQGFNLVQAVVLAEQQGLTLPNANGDLPLIDLDPTRPNEAYFEHVDRIVEAANSRGIVVGMLPTWGDKFNKKWGTGPEVFTPQNAETFGRYLGKRYKYASIVWILGGDRIPEEEEDFAIIEAMAKGLAEGDGGKHLMSYHPQGRQRSSNFFHQADWLDINMHQSGHGDLDYTNFKDTYSDYQLHPAKPTLDGEPMYEDIPIGFKVENGWFTAFEGRRAGYWSMLSGAMGHTYGHHSVWQMWEPGVPPALSPRTPWQEAIYYPGAWQAGYMKTLFERIKWWELQPEQALLVEGPTDGAAAIRVAASPDHSLIVVYTPEGSNFSLKAEATFKTAFWHNPRIGKDVPIHQQNWQDGLLHLDPPADPARGNDWLLVLSTAEIH